ncbi:hypothetical protein RJY75_26300 [Escherichia coli]|uniref:hypothetical protein n=1 Tax=Escherichia coli TaxID=562 RepID=UPI00287A5B4E|nr:hypothetical protein [Escherichia coli]MDS4101232.1 hypothetical protein [Escherichia coli]
MKTGIKITLPSIKLQRMEIFKQGIEQSILALQENAAAAPYPKAKAVDYSSLDERYFLTVEQGWIAPPHKLVNAWFEQFKSTFPEYGSDSSLATLLGIHSNGASRRIREYRNGEKPIPYGIWRKFLVLTGRAPQEIIPVFGVFDTEGND